MMNRTTTTDLFADKTLACLHVSDVEDFNQTFVYIYQEQASNGKLIIKRKKRLGSTCVRKNTGKIRKFDCRERIRCWSSDVEKNKNITRMWRKQSAIAIQEDDSH